MRQGQALSDESLGSRYGPQVNLDTLSSYFSALQQPTNAAAVQAQWFASIEVLAGWGAAIQAAMDEASVYLPSLSTALEDCLVTWRSDIGLPSTDTEIVFRHLRDRWRAERPAYSSLAVNHAMCWPYQQIIGMGPKAVGLILKELRATQEDPEDWFWALDAILGPDNGPVSEDILGDTYEMGQAWLRWGAEHGYLL